MDELEITLSMLQEFSSKDRPPCNCYNSGVICKNCKEYGTPCANCLRYCDPWKGLFKNRLVEAAGAATAANYYAYTARKNNSKRKCEFEDRDEDEP